jgi:four helix bundle protein
MSHELTLAVYRVTRTFPDAEKYGITSQLRRSASSIPANIAEGCGRLGGEDSARFFQIALGSAFESDYFLLLGKDLGFMEIAEYESLSAQVQDIQKMLRSLILKTRAPASKAKPTSTSTKNSNHEPGFSNPS